MKNLSTLFGNDNLDEIVFSNRNKAYGAYALRNNYANDLTKAVLIGVAFFGSISIIPLVFSAFQDKAVLPVEDHSKREITIIKEVDTPKPPTAAVMPQKVKTVASPEFKPVKELKADKPMPTDADKKNAAVSSVTSAGPETTLTTVPPMIVAGPPSVAPPSVAPVKAEDPDKIRTVAEVDVAADFKGGINAFREKVAQNFDTEAVDKGGMVSAIITFVVETNGSISHLKINGSNTDFNAEAERAIKSIKAKWSPAQLNGKPVRSAFRMPISMKIE